jgi:enamine deaminase RidA (YjgF/YER057c/UK114 family)
MKPITPKGFGAPLGMYSHGVVAQPGELVVVAGQVGMSATGEVAVGDVIAQTKQAFDNVRSVIEAGGCSMRDVVRLQTFVTRAADIAGFMKARAEIFPQYFPDGVYPPNTLLVISQLVRPDLLVEIEAIAVRRKTRTAATSRKTGTRRRPRR